MIVVAAAVLIGSAVVAWTIARTARPSADARVDPSRDRALQLLVAFAPAATAAVSDPRAVLAWQPVARVARRLFREEFALLDAAAGARFPFAPDQIQAAHGQWTADWLAWECAHDAEYKLKAAAAEADLAASNTPLARARLDAVEREKLELYQRRYQEYVRVAKAHQALATAAD
jgi:hypothetical protein